MPYFPAFIYRAKIVALCIAVQVCDATAAIIGISPALINYFIDKFIIMNKTLDIVLKRFNGAVPGRVPDVSAIINVMLKEGAIENAADVENDHIAFRTLGVP